MTPAEWLSNMRDIWLSKNPEMISELLSEEIKYYENPFDPPLTNVSDIVSAWQEIKNQEIDYLEIEILHEDKNVAMALWRFKQANEIECVGSYFLKLDGKGKCVQFRQWWNSPYSEAE